MMRYTDISTIAYYWLLLGGAETSCGTYGRVSSFDGRGCLDADPRLTIRTLQWNDPSYSGVAPAGKYHEYFASGEHKVHSYEQKPTYKQKKNIPPGVVVGRGGNL
eukprot:1193090-Prorocentrum_minimum.AAC.1